MSCKQCSLLTLSILSPSCAFNGIEVSMLDTLQAEGEKAGSPLSRFYQAGLPCASLKILQPYLQMFGLFWKFESFANLTLHQAQQTAGFWEDGFRSLFSQTRISAQQTRLILPVPPLRNANHPGALTKAGNEHLQGVIQPFRRPVLKMDGVGCTVEVPISFLSMENATLCMCRL